MKNTPDNYADDEIILFLCCIGILFGLYHLLTASYFIQTVRLLLSDVFVNI